VKADPSTAAPAAAAGGTWQALLQQQELLMVCSQGMPAAVGMSSPVSGSYSSSDSKDPAVLELEQFMLQELAAAGMMVMDSSSATAVPMLLAAATPAPAAQQPSWQQQTLLDQQQHAPASMLALQQLHQLDVTSQHVHKHWHSASHATTGADMSCMPGAAAAGAAGTWVPASAAGSLALVRPASQGQQGMLPALPGPAAAGPAVYGKARAHMMARLQERLQSLAAQMGDMQLMLRLLQDA
jgi:hypothetical protein